MSVVVGAYTAGQVADLAADRTDRYPASKCHICEIRIDHIEKATDLSQCGLCLIALILMVRYHQLSYFLEYDFSRMHEI